MNPKKILFAHSGGAQDGPGEGSFDLVSRLRIELADEYEISFPIIEDTDSPTYEMWVNLFDKELKSLEEPIILVGHSFGASMILKYLAQEKPVIKIAALFLVAAPQWGKDGWDVEEYELPENFEIAISQIENVFLYHCKEDDIVPFEHFEFYKKAIPHAKLRILKGSAHAFEEGLPELVADLKELVQ